MAKKKKETKVEEPIVEETVVMEKPVVETPKVEVKPEIKNPKSSNDWEIKNRIYYLKGRKKPLSRMIRSANIYYFDEEKGYERELKYCQNQKTCFVDEMKGDQRLEHIIFRNGALYVPREQVVLQKLLSLYHPHKDQIFYEHKPKVVAENALAWLEFEIEALGLAKNMEVDFAEAIMRAEVGSKVDNLSSKELKRDLLLYAKRNTRLFLSLINDENVMIRKLKQVGGNLKPSSSQKHYTEQYQRFYNHGTRSRRIYFL